MALPGLGLLQVHCIQCALVRSGNFNRSFVSVALHGHGDGPGPGARLGGSLKEAGALMKKLKMPDVEWMPPGRVQRSWYADVTVPNSPLLERAIVAAAAGKHAPQKLAVCRPIKL